MNKDHLRRLAGITSLNENFPFSGHPGNGYPSTEKITPAEPPKPEVNKHEPAGDLGEIETHLKNASRALKEYKPHSPATTDAHITAQHKVLSAIKAVHDLQQLFSHADNS